MGAVEQSIAKQALRANQPLPDRIKNAPKLALGLGLYMQAFYDLDSERNHLNGPMPIPWTSIKQYAETFEFSSEQTEDLFYLIKQMDSHNLKRVGNKIQQSNKAAQTKGKQRGKR